MNYELIVNGKSMTVFYYPFAREVLQEYPSSLLSAINYFKTELFAVEISFLFEKMQVKF